MNQKVETRIVVRTPLAEEELDIARLELTVVGLLGALHGEGDGVRQGGRKVP